MFERRRPRDKLEAEAVVDHGETPGGKGHPLAVDPGDVLALSCRLVGKARLRRELSRGRFKLTPAKTFEEVTGKDNALALMACEAFLDKMIDAGTHRLAHLAAEAAFGQGDGFLCNELAIEPGGPLRRHLVVDREI